MTGASSPWITPRAPAQMTRVTSPVGTHPQSQARKRRLYGKLRQEPPRGHSFT
jgi:hypothetical protein